MRFRTLGGCAAALMLVSATVSVAGTPSTPPERGGTPVPDGTGAVFPDAAALQASATYLGFRIGDERRYVLGPPEKLYRGEYASWSIRLREVLAEPPDAIFELEHGWARAEANTRPPTGTVMSVSSSGELRVNAHGFPIELRFRTERDLFLFGERVYTVRYRFEDGEFRKLFDMEGVDFEHAVRTFRADGMDAPLPSGMWTLAPMALECMFLRPPPGNYGPNGAPISPPAARPAGRTMMPGARPGLAQEAECREPLFANPGLLSLMLPTLWEAGTGELDFLMLTPAGYFGTPGASGGANLGGTSTGFAPRHFDSELASRAQTNSDADSLRYVDRSRVEIGPRTRDAWRFEGIRAFDAVFVDDDGVVLRVDLAPRVSPPVAAGSRGFPDAGNIDTRDLWIRLLYPSEY